ncbi:MAG: signal peptidase I [Planctomycetota bacterium]|nr:signal peptidase I [Planctomycetota bacterium]
MEAGSERTEKGGGTLPKEKAGGPGRGAETGAEGTEGEKEGGERVGSRLRGWVDLAVRAGFWALVIYMFVFQVSVVYGISMLPNFDTNDRLVVDKISCRVGVINRFDVVVFEAVVCEKGQYRRKDFIKRVIGLPGERVEIKGGCILINGEPLNEEYRTLGRCEDGVWEVPEGRYFVLGDNRSVSNDSRRYIGLVADSQIKGKVRLRFWPWEKRSWF